MILLHIAHVDNNVCAGVNVAVRDFVRSHEKNDTAALLNVAGEVIDGVQSCYLYKNHPRIAELPSPFCKPDIIIFHEIYRPAFLKLSSEARGAAIPYVIVPHGGLTSKAQSIKFLKKTVANSLLFNRYIKNAAAIQYLSERELAESCKGKVTFIGSNGVDQITRKEHLPDKIQKYVYVGRLDIYIKGIDLLLQALSDHREFLIKEQCRFDIYGPDENGSHGKISKMIHDLGIGDIAFLHGPVCGADKEAVLKNSDCFVQTSRSEGMSIGILEALAYGLPCVLTEGTSMTDLLCRYHAGWMCKTDAEDIGRAIIDSVNDRETIGEKSDGAITLVQQCFLRDKVVRDTIEQYQKIAKRV